MNEPGAALRVALGKRRRAELGAFLRARRALVQPGDVGLAGRTRRHVPGLRREEVAHVARVGLSWYAMLEQGRVERVSRKALRRVIESLRLTPMESEHAFALARDDEGQFESSSGSLEALVAFVRNYGDGAAFLSDAATRIVAWNAFAGDLFGFSEHPDSERTILGLMVRDSKFANTFVDRYDTLARMIGVFRSTYAENAGPELDALVRDLRAESSEFDTLWLAYAIDTATTHVCRLRHTRFGDVRMHFFAFAPVDHPGYTLVALRPLRDEE